MKKFRHLYIELYGINIYYIQCPYPDYERRVAAEFGCNAPRNVSSATGRFQVYEKGPTEVGILWLSAKAGVDELVHECLHCVHYFMQFKGLSLSDNSEEAYAYLLQHIFNKTKRLLKK